MPSEITKVTLEILRHGPAHNQPLSPLTNYLALCGNHGATSINVPFEHRQFESQLRPLLYTAKDDDRQQQLVDTGSTMRDILQRIPGLIASLAEAAGGGGADPDSRPPVHLELILSASELSLLPFELAATPAGCPGTGAPLITQLQMPLCITRRVRQQKVPATKWNRVPRVLFAAASPTATVPLEEHCEAFIMAINGWIDWSQVERGNVVQMYREYLTVLPQASLQGIKAELARALGSPQERPYTHVHILAHGVSYTDAGESRYGLAFHHPQDARQSITVSGAELAAALFAAATNGTKMFSCPTVVTLASCQGAAQGGVLGTGASIAHTLHETGVPLVVASQFPLTFPGSIEMVRSLYHGFFRGHDPRMLLKELRQSLLITPETGHDWASLVAYASFDSAMESELAELRYIQARRAVELALDGFDRQLALSKQFLTNATRGRRQLTRVDDQTRQRFKDLTRWLESASRRLGLVAKERAVDGRVSLHGLMAATMKKLAHWQWRESIMAGDPSVPPETGTSTQNAAPHLISLHSACQLYERAAREMPTANWARTQELCLRLVLGCATHDQATKLWRKAWRGVQWELLSGEADDRLTHIIALRNAVELQILAQMLALPASGTNGKTPVSRQDKAEQLLRKFCKTAGPGHMEFRSLRQQLERYRDFFRTVACKPINKQAFAVSPSQWNKIDTHAGYLTNIMDLYRPACGFPDQCSCDQPEVSY